MNVVLQAQVWLLDICAPAAAAAAADAAHTCAAMESQNVELRDELKEQLAEEAAQKANPGQPKTPSSARAASGALSNGHPPNGVPALHLL